MAFIDPFFDEELRRMRRRIEELHRIAEAYMARMEALFEERLRELSDGATSPLVSFQDLGDRLAIIVDLPGAKPGSLSIQLTEDTLYIEGVIDERVVREALGDVVWARSVRRFRGAYRLPVRVDPSRAEKTMRGSTLVIIAPKKEGVEEG